MDRRLPLVLALMPVFGQACMGLGRPSQPVRFAGQTNIVIWDQAHGLEHFVRDARFETNGPDLGFIAPTPSRPEVSSADPAAFSLLDSLLRTPFPSDRGGAFSLGGGGLGGRVEVVETKIVSGYEATVLKTNDPRALFDWLDQHGYAASNDAARWADRYVRRGWYFTAFKVAAGDGAGATGPVRLSFRTHVAFNPYSVPRENQGRGGLKLYYISPTAETPRIGGVQPWVESHVSDLVSDANATKLASELKLPGSAIPHRSFVRLYEDPRFGRPGFDDVYFVSAPAPVRRVPKVPSALVTLTVFAFVRIGRRSC